MASPKKWERTWPTSSTTPLTGASTRRNRTVLGCAKWHIPETTAYRPPPSGDSWRPSTVQRDCGKADTRNYLEPQNFENACIDQNFYKRCPGIRSHFTCEKGIGGTRQHPLPGRLKSGKVKGAPPRTTAFRRISSKGYGQYVTNWDTLFQPHLW